jgi:hypothetical protein
MMPPPGLQATCGVVVKEIPDPSFGKESGKDIMHCAFDWAKIRKNTAGL